MDVTKHDAHIYIYNIFLLETRLVNKVYSNTKTGRVECSSGGMRRRIGVVPWLQFTVSTTNYHNSLIVVKYPLPCFTRLGTASATASSASAWADPAARRQEDSHPLACFGFPLQRCMLHTTWRLIPFDYLAPFGSLAVSFGPSWFPLAPRWLSLAHFWFLFVLLISF